MSKVPVHRFVALGAVLAALTLVVTGAAQAQQATTTLKMQASWPTTLTLYDNFKMFAEKVDKMSGGRLKIETMPAGTVVPAFEVLDATNKKVIDGHHSWAGYWVGKNKTGILFTGGPGGTFGMDYVDVIGWLFHGGGMELYQQYYKEVLKLDVVPIPVLPAGPQAFGWFKRPIKNLADFKGMKCRQTGIAAEVYTEMGMRVVNMPGGEIMPAAERGVIDCAEWVGGVEDLRFGFHNIWKYHYTPGMHETVTIGEAVFNGDVWRKLSPDLQEIVKAAAMDTLFRWWALWQKQNADAIAEMQEKHKVQILKTPDDILLDFLKAWDRIAARESEKDPFFKKVLESQKTYAAKVVPAKRFMFAPYSFAANYYWPEKKAGAAPAPAAKSPAPAPAKPAAKPAEKK
jgi:TRAP-type mannitol/chloroaromatic compound transport system substrate-binding protein